MTAQNQTLPKLVVRIRSRHPLNMRDLRRKAVSPPQEGRSIKIRSCSFGVDLSWPFANRLRDLMKRRGSSRGCDGR
jgi:hypothetical protein